MLVQGVISTKPSTGGEAEGSAEGLRSRRSQPPSPPERPTHSGHRGGTAGRWRDGSSARCRNFRGTWHKWCPGRGHIQPRRVCLGCERGSGSVRGLGFPHALCCLLCDPGPVAVPTREGRPVSLTLCFCRRVLLGAGVHLPSEAAMWAGAPCDPPPRPRLPAAPVSHLGGSGSSRRDAWARSTPFPGPSRFGSPCGRGAPSRGDGVRREVFSSRLGRAEGLQRGRPRPLFPG